jgi:hypothetical protein
LAGATRTPVALAVSASSMANSDGGSMVRARRWGSGAAAGVKRKGEET